MAISTMFCTGCGWELDEDNWYPSFQKRGYHKCRTCHRGDVRAAFCATCATPLQGGRCSTCDAERPCARCGVKLTDENWAPSFKKRNVARCKLCHKALVDDWSARNPDNARQREARWRARNPNHGKEYYRNNVEDFAERARRNLWQYKIAALNMLGGKCTVCGITDMRVLQINHTNGGGVQEKRFGMDMYSAIVKGTRTTDDLDVRCANHNLLYEYERGKRRLPTGLDFAASAVDEASL
jgi:hypothetical protein